MKRAKEALEIVNKIDEKYNQTGVIKQFTIDMIEHFSEELNEYVYANHYDNEADDICSDWQQLSHHEIAKKVLEELKKE